MQSQKNRGHNRNLGKRINELTTWLKERNQITFEGDHLKWKNAIKATVERYENAFKFFEPFTVLLQKFYVFIFLFSIYFRLYNLLCKVH